MKRAIRVFFVTAILCLSSFVAYSGFVSKTFIKKSYPGSKNRNYQLYIPSTYNPSTPVPLVMAIHGCVQTEQTVINEWQWQDVAEENNVIVVFPFITSYDGMRNENCWGFWFPAEIHEGEGEVADLYNIAKEVEASYNIDPNHIHATGLSSGGAITVALGVAYNEYFASVASSEGIAYGETSSSVNFSGCTGGIFESVATTVNDMNAELNSSRVIPMMVVHSNNDCVVRIPAGRNIRDSWISAFGMNTTAYESGSCSNEGVTCDHKKYKRSESARSEVETVFYNGRTLRDQSHYWVGNGSGSYAYATGPDSSRTIWQFFATHGFSENQSPNVAISSATADGTSITVSGSASDTDGTVTSVTVRLDGQFPVGDQTASGTDNWTITFAGLTDDAYYTPVVTATDNSAAETEVSGSPLAVGTPPVAPSITATASSEVGSGCIDVEGTATAGSGGLDRVQVKIDTGTWENATGLETYTFQTCNQSWGDRAVIARACDIEDLCTETAPLTVTVQAGYLTETGTTLSFNHRFDNYDIGWGLCDRTYLDLYNEFGNNGEFTIYGTEDESVWCYYSHNLPDSGGGSGGGGDFECQDNNSSNYTHVTAGRANTCGSFNSYACTVGSGDNLGLYNIFTVTDVKETSEGYFEAGTCP